MRMYACVLQTREILALPAPIATISTRFFIDCPPHTPGFYRVLPSDGDCMHADELWQAEPLRCSACQTRATLYTFPRDAVDCEHSESWTTDLRQPLCDTCGFMDTGTGEYETFKAQAQRKLESTRKRDKKSQRSGNTPARRKRFKLDITKDAITGLGDPRIMAEQRLQAFKVSQASTF